MTLVTKFNTAEPLSCGTILATPFTNVSLSFLMGSAVSGMGATRGFGTHEFHFCGTFSCPCRSSSGFTVKVTNSEPLP